MALRQAQGERVVGMSALLTDISFFDELTLMFDKRQGKGCIAPFPAL